MVTKSAKRVTGFLGTSALTRPLFMLGAASALLGAGPAQALDANTLPQNPNVVGGRDTFHQSGNTLNVNQSTNRTVIDWRSFNIGSNAQVNFAQPGTSSIAVNRVNASANASQIEGGLHANGQVWILNPNGVFFGKTARVDAAGIVASTANIDTKAFMAGSNTLQMTGADHGSVENQGNITVGANGLAAFVAPSVRNSGTINATVGRVALAAGTTYTLDLAGDHLVELGLGSVKAVVDQSGRIVNPGGTIALTAKAAGQVVNSVVNVSGVVSASSVSKSGGTITFGADTINTTATAQISADAGTNGTGGTITSVANVQGNYAGSFSAKGGSQSGNGGKIETSGKSVHVDSGITINTLASNGLTGSWTLDPDDLTIQSGSGDTLSGSSNTDGQSSIDAGTVVTALDSTDVTLQARNSITVNSAIDASGNANAHNLTLADQDAPGLTINLNAPITLKGAGVLSGDGTDVNVNAGALIQNGVDVARSGGAVNIGAGTFTGAVNVNTAGLTISGVPGTIVTAISGTDTNHAAANSAFSISAGGVTLQNLEILGPVSGDYRTVDWGALAEGYSWGVRILPNAGGVSVKNTTIESVRSGILIDGNGNGGTSITGNTIENTKGAVLVQYTAGDDLTISGNKQGPLGNEWGVVLDLNTGTPTNTAAPDARQAHILSLSTSNNGWTVMDRQYQLANRSSVFVDDNSTATAADDFSYGNGLGNERQPLKTIQSGVYAVVAGGTVDVEAGNYTLASTLTIDKSLSLVGAGVGATNITSNSGSYGIDVIGDDVSLKDFTFHGPTAVASGTYGIKVEPNSSVASDRLLNFDIENVTIDQGYRTGLDLNGVLGATIKNVSVSNIAHGNGMALTDSANVTITGSTTTNNLWGGLALYQNNSFYDQQVNNISVDGTNRFNELNPVYLQDESASLNFDFATLNIAGYNYAVLNPSGRTQGDGATFIWLQNDQQKAVDFAMGSFGMVNTGSSYIEGWNSGLTNAFTVGTSTGDDAMSIAAANSAASNGATIDVLAGNYTLSGELDVTKGLTLSGAGVGVTNITSNSTGYGIYVTGDNVSLKDFTYHGPTYQGSPPGSRAATYGIKVEPGTNVATDRLTDFDIENVTIDQGYRTGLDLNGVDGATIKNVSVSNIVWGAGIALTDSANVTITGSTTTNNTFGGLALFQTNNFYDQQVNNITVDGTDHFTESNPIYGEDQSTTKDFGTLNLPGYDFIAQFSAGVNDFYTLFRTSEQGAIDSAVAASPTTAYVQGYTGNGETGNNTFYVGHNTGDTGALSIATAVGAASSGGTVNVLAGSYTEDVTVGKQLEFNFDGTTVNSFTLASGGAGSELNGDLTTTGAIALNDAATVAGNLTAASFTSNATLAMTGNLKTSGATALNGASTVTGDVTADSLTTGSTLALVGDLVVTNGVTLGGASTITGDVTADSLTTGSTLALTGDLVAANSVTLGGASTITGDVSAKTFTANGTLALNGDLAATGAALFNGASSVNGDLKAASITANDVFALNGDATATGAIALNGATALAGSLTGGSIALGATTLTGNTALSAANGAIVVASVNGSTAGGQSLAINAGTAGSVSLGNLGATTRLGAVSDASKTKLTGSTYNANSFLFGGDVTLTSATTALNTTQSSSAAGDITFQGDLFGTTDGGQSLTLIAGPGTGAASANGDITLQNAGNTAVNLNNLTVSGDNFTALTVDLAGDYNSILTGNQVFAADTLNVKGNATGTVGGDASGHVVAGGDVSFAAQGDVSGTINGQNVNLSGNDVNANVTAGNTATINGSTVEGSYTADTVVLTASNNVNAAVNATDFTLAAQSGSVDGTWTNIDTSGSNVVSVNGQTTVGFADVNPNQLVVEGFVLPNGTIIGANGELILPQGVLLGLLSPGGGKPKMILVHTVHQLGELLASGYSVIVIDLSNRDSGKPIQLASN